MLKLTGSSLSHLPYKIILKIYKHAIEMLKLQQNDVWLIKNDVNKKTNYI